MMLSRWRSVSGFRDACSACGAQLSAPSVSNTAMANVFRTAGSWLACGPMVEEVIGRAP
jgi:hypothetical protein